VPALSVITIALGQASTAKRNFSPANVFADRSLIMLEIPTALPIADPGAADAARAPILPVEAEMMS
jgi:hypothetical protein